MNMENGYLTDEELEALILEVEENELVSAPPDFMDVISEKIEGLQEIGDLFCEDAMERPQEEPICFIQKTGDLSCKDIVEMQKKKELSRKRKQIEFHRYCIRVIASVAAAIAIVFALPNVELMKVPQENVLIRKELIGKSISREEALDNSNIITKLMNRLNDKTGGFLDETEKEK